MARTVFREAFPFVYAPLALIGACAFPATARANDGGIALGGTPGLLKGHPSVSMTRELIRITVGKRQLTADCNFLFTNQGSACSVRMGFPDRGFGASDPDAEHTDDAMSSSPRTTFKSFRSFVDGRPVATRLIRADVEGQYWHTKTVSFAAHGTHRIRDVYIQAIGGGVAQIHGKMAMASQIGYILHTGASWHGQIGRTEVIVDFGPSALKAPLVHAKEGSDARDQDSLLAPNALLWKGPCTPTVQGKLLRFVRSNWRPKDADDIELTYNYRPSNLGEEPTAAQLTAEVRNSDAQERAARADLETRYLAYSHAFDHKDFSRIGKRLTRDYRWVPPDGADSRKRQYLEMLAEHPATSKMMFEIQAVQFHVDKVVVTVKQTFSEPTPKDDHPNQTFQNVYRYRLRDTWIRSPQGWKLNRTELIG